MVERHWLQSQNVSRPRQKSVQGSWPAALCLKGPICGIFSFRGILIIYMLPNRVIVHCPPPPGPRHTQVHFHLHWFPGVGHLHHPLLRWRSCKRTNSAQVSAGGRRPTSDGWRFHPQQVDSHSHDFSFGKVLCIPNFNVARQAKIRSTWKLLIVS